MKITEKGWEKKNLEFKRFHTVMLSMLASKELWLSLYIKGKDKIYLVYSHCSLLWKQGPIRDYKSWGGTFLEQKVRKEWVLGWQERDYFDVKVKTWQVKVLARLSWRKQNRKWKWRQDIIMRKVKVTLTWISATMNVRPPMAELFSDS